MERNAPGSRTTAIDDNRHVRSVAIVLAFAVATLAADQDRPVFRTGTRLTSIDVIVYKDGRPVGDLTAEDFKIQEDGKDQKIEFLQVIDTTRALVPAASILAPATSGAQEVTNRPNGRIPVTATAVLFDRLNTRFEDQVAAREEVIKFFSQMKPEERVALYVLDSNELRILHDFTRDASALVRTMARFRGSTSTELAAGDAPAGPLAPMGIDDLDADTARWLEATRVMIETQTTIQRARSTLSALEAIAKHLAGVSGRKNLVWVSSSFPLIIGGGNDRYSITDELSHAVRAVSSAGIAIYPVDTRRLIAPFEGVKPTETLVGIGRNAPSIPNPSGLSMTMPNADTMDELATRTGGRAYYNTNNIAGAIAKAIDDSRVTYVVGYYPTNDKWNDTFRTVKVSVRRPGVDVRHRSGYLGSPTPSAKSDPLDNIARGTLDATGIGLTVSLDGDSVAVRVDPSGITMRPDGDMFDVSLELLIAQRLPDGELLKDLDKTLSLRLSSAQRDQLLKEGFSMTRTVALKSGASLRVVVRDQPTGVAGSVSVVSRP